MADIVTVPEGNYTPGARAALENTAALINASWNQANEKTTAFQNKVDALDTYLEGVVVPDIAADVSPTPAVVEPVVEIPQTQSAGEVMALFDTKYGELVTLLSDKFIAFRSAYFPNEQATYTAAESWLKAALENQNAGLPTAVADQMLEDDRTRILNDVNRASDAVLATFAARRFSLPPGAAAGAVLQIQQKGQEEIAASSRKITVASIEQMKFAVTAVMSLRQAAMGAAIDYIRALAAGPDMASRLVGVGYDAQSKLITSAASFYNARTNAAQLVAQADQFNVTSKLTAAEKNQRVDLALVEERVKLLVTEAQALAQMATSMFNNLNAGSGTSYSVNGT